MSDNLKRHLESAFLTFIAFFLMDMGTSIQAITSQPISTITWATFTSILVAAARSAVKVVWEKWVNPPTQG